MRIVIALGGNALLRRGQAMTNENQRENVAVAARRIAEVAGENEIIVAHGNGPQVGLLALQNDAYKDKVAPYPLDVLGAQTQAMIGYMIEQELGNLVDKKRPLATLLTNVEVDPKDPAFENPTKPIGPVYDRDEAEALAKEQGWTIAPDGDKFRRVVASPQPKSIVQIDAIRALLERDTIVVCTGGGGIPTAFEDGKGYGVECVIDKDLASALLAAELEADMLIIATDVDGVYLDWGTPEQRKLEAASVAELEGSEFAAGSMGPKVKAACKFASAGEGKVAVIGSLDDISNIVAGHGGTRVTL